MMEIQEVHKGGYLDIDREGCCTVNENGKIRAFFLDKEDAQRFIRNETIRRETEERQSVLAEYLDGGVEAEKFIAAIARDAANAPLQPSAQALMSGKPFRPGNGGHNAGFTICGREEDIPDPDDIVEVEHGS